MNQNDVLTVLRKGPMTVEDIAKALDPETEIVTTKERAKVQEKLEKLRDWGLAKVVGQRFTGGYLYNVWSLTEGSE